MVAKAKALTDHARSRDDSTRSTQVCKNEPKIDPKMLLFAHDILLGLHGDDWKYAMHSSCLSEQSKSPLSFFYTSACHFHFVIIMIAAPSTAVLLLPRIFLGLQHMQSHYCSGELCVNSLRHLVHPRHVFVLLNAIFGGAMA